MTGEEAINILSRPKTIKSTPNDILEAHDMAIKALERESCDCISREGAKQFLYERLDIINDDELYDIFSRIIDDMYNELPFVEREPKQEPILDKIRAEIKDLTYYWCEINPKTVIDDVLEILDKYKIESGV